MRIDWKMKGFRLALLDLWRIGLELIGRLVRRVDAEFGLQGTFIRVLVG
jgi:hypothetical protein